MYEYHAEVVRVIDGDTVALAVDLGCDVTLNLTVRLYGINCPEMSGESRLQGGMAKAFTEGWLREAAELDGGTVTLKTLKDKREKYGRYLGIIHNDIGGCLNDDLVAQGHAVRKEYR